MLKQKYILDSNSRLIEDQYYFNNFLLLKFIITYVKDASFGILYLFGFLPVWRFNVTAEMISQRRVLTRNIKSKYTLDASRITAQNIAQALLSEDIEVKIKRLLGGLDENSTKCVNTILARLGGSIILKNKRITILSKAEEKTLERIEREFYPNILYLRNSYCYNGFFLPIKHFEISVFWHKHGLDKLRNLTMLMDKNIIDVGAFIGDSAIVLSNYTNCKIYSFEAIGENYNLMLETIKLNNAGKVIPIKKALGAESGSIKITRCGSTSSAVMLHNADFEEVEIITLDSFVRENNIEVGFIKVDIEGFEMPFLQGALETIKSQKPTMLISIYHQASDFFDIKPFLDDLKLGYTFKIYKPIDFSVSGETCLLCEILEN